MKKILLSIALAIFTTGLSSVDAANIQVNINIGSQPAWGPIGYNYAAFYYFPDINVYYDVNMRMFHYPHQGRWVSAQFLPPVYRHYDLFRLYKVVLTNNNPWAYNQRHVVDYRHFKGNRNQVVIRSSNDARYRDSRNNNIRWYNDNHNDRTTNINYQPKRDERNQNYSESKPRNTADRKIESRSKDKSRSQNQTSRSSASRTR